MPQSRGYLTLRDLQDDETLQDVFEAAAESVRSGTAQVRRGEPTGATCLVSGDRLVLASGVLEFVLFRVPADEFDAEVAKAFVEQARQLLGWAEIGYTLRCWAETRLCEGWFHNAGTRWQKEWVRNAEMDPSSLPPAFFDFACYVALGELKYGPSYAFVTANEIFGWVTALGSDLPARLKRDGSGALPPALARFRTDTVTGTANDALAVIRLRVLEESEEAYASALGYLIELLTTTDFPRTYALEFRGPTKTYLPIKGLPKKGVHQFFAAAAAYPGLRPALERYARAAMGEFEWYRNLEGEHCAMPGTFAVFALGLAAPTYSPLVCEYLRLVDGEHHSVHGKFVEAYVAEHGFTPEAIAYLVACASNIQHLRLPATSRSQVANQASLEALLAAKVELGDDGLFSYTRYAIWGGPATRDGRHEVIRKAPAGLRPLYEAIFAESARP